MRGKVSSYVLIKFTNGITPAYAGKSQKRVNKLIP